MAITRRSALLSFTAPALFAQEKPVGKFSPGYTAESGGTKIMIVADREAVSWLVGLSTNQKADMASVDVFYEAMADGIKKPILLHKTSLCPVVDPPGMGATDQNFSVPLKDVRFIRVTFFKTVGREEFR